jgi:hypothetical protein
MSVLLVLTVLTVTNVVVPLVTLWLDLQMGFSPHEMIVTLAIMSVPFALTVWYAGVVLDDLRRAK